MSIHRLAASLMATLAPACLTRAQEPPPQLLLHPQTAFVAAADAVGDDLSVDGQPSALGAPTVLWQKSTAEADFVAAAWKDASGQTVRQREVLVVKPFYAVVVDHLYTPDGSHAVTRQIGLSPGPKIEGATADFPLTQGVTLRCQANEKPLNNPRVEWKDNVLTFHSRAMLPAPISTVFAAGTSLPTIAYVKPSNPMIVKCLVTFPDGREDEVAVAWEPRSLHIGGKALQGWAACVSKGPAGEKQIEIRP